MRIGIIGHFGGIEDFNDGQTIKVKSLYDGIKRYLPNVHIDKIDTYYFHKKDIRIIFSLFKSILFDKYIIFLPATNGRRFLFEFMYYIGKIPGKKIYHDAIGGALVKELDIHPEWVSYLNSYELSWMESVDQVEQLKRKGVNNAKYIPNFKKLAPIDSSELVYEAMKPYKFCMFCRMEEMKGVSDAVEAIRAINYEHNQIVATLDLYGPIQPGLENWFSNITDEAKDFCSYCGVVEANKSVEVLKDYFVLLFPTRYYTEGMPGTIIDAMFAGLPVLARKWAYCDQMLDDGYNGYTYEFNHPELLKNRIIELIENPNMVCSIRKNCLEEAMKYSEKTVINDILKDMRIERYLKR